MQFDLSHTHPLISTIYDISYQFRRGVMQFRHNQFLIQIGIGSDDAYQPEITIALISATTHKEFECIYILTPSGKVVARQHSEYDEKNPQLIDTELVQVVELAEAYNRLENLRALLTHPDTIEVFPFDHTMPISKEMSEGMCLKYVEMGFLGDPMEELRDDQTYLDLKIDGQYIM